MIHRDADEGEELRVARLDPARHEDGVGRDAICLHAALDQVDVEVDEPTHFDRPAEGDLPIALAEVQVTPGEQGPRHVHGKEDARAPGEVLDVVVAAVLPGRHRARPLLGHPLVVRAGERAQQRPGAQRRECQGRHPVRGGRDESRLAPVPAAQQLRRRRHPEEARVGDAGVPHPGQMPRRRLLAVKVPDGLGRVWIVVGEEAAGVVAVEYPRVPPTLPGYVASLLRDRAQVEDVEHQKIARFRPFHGEGAGQHVGNRQVDVANVVGRIIVTDLAVGPFPALDTHLGTRFDRRHGRDVRVPAVVARHGLLAHGPAGIDAEDDLGHGSPGGVVASDPGAGQTG